MPYVNGEEVMPTGPDPEAELPQAVKDHLGHPGDFRDAVRDGSQAAKDMATRAAQLEHVLADVIDYIRLTREGRL